MKHNDIAIISLKSLYTVGIQTRVFWSQGGCDVHCATPPLEQVDIFINFFDILAVADFDVDMGT
jgi:hypothetical protein